jgi:hypothetical protein
MMRGWYLDLFWMGIAVLVLTLAFGDPTTWGMR